MKQHIIPKTSECSIKSGEIEWGRLPSLSVDVYPWDANGYKPEVEVKLFYTDSHIHINFKAYEKKINAEFLNMNDPVCRDSCVEFFFNPNPEYDSRYLNFETNPVGTLLLGLGKDRHDRYKVQDVSQDIFRIETSVTKESLQSYNSEFWTVDYSIPFSFIETHYGKIDFSSGHKIMANFYKCGDDTQYPHYGCWNPVSNPVPDFHRPESFGCLILE